MNTNITNPVPSYGSGQIQALGGNGHGFGGNGGATHRIGGSSPASWGAGWFGPVIHLLIALLVVAAIVAIAIIVTRTILKARQIAVVGVGTGGPTIPDRLAQLEQLRSAGTVSKDEYASRRTRILDEL